jgi:uncharacterized membrane protein
MQKQISPDSDSRLSNTGKITGSGNALFLIIEIMVTVSLIIIVIYFITDKSQQSSVHGKKKLGDHQNIKKYNILYVIYI